MKHVYMFIILGVMATGQTDAVTAGAGAGTGLGAQPEGIGGGASSGIMHNPLHPSQRFANPMNFATEYREAVNSRPDMSLEGFYREKVIPARSKTSPLLFNHTVYDLELLKYDNTPENYYKLWDFYTNLKTSLGEKIQEFREHPKKEELTAALYNGVIGLTTGIWQAITGNSLAAFGALGGTAVIGLMSIYKYNSAPGTLSICKCRRSDKSAIRVLNRTILEDSLHEIALYETLRLKGQVIEVPEIDRDTSLLEEAIINRLKEFKQGVERLSIFVIRDPSRVMNLRRG